MSAKLYFDLYDIERKLIAKSGTELDDSELREVVGKGKHLQGKTVSLNHAVFLKDVDRVMREETYERIFSPVFERKKILDLIRKARMQESLFREIYTLKRTSPYTYRHCLLIGSLSAKMGQDLKSYGCDPAEAFVMGLVHDIGKTRLPKKVLNKAAPLTSTEYRILRSYPIVSLFLLKYYLGKKGTEACRVAFDHHEKLDGTGYPRGIKNITRATKLIAIADIFDALVSDRPYRKRDFTVRGALEKLVGEMNKGRLPRFPVLLLISYMRKDKPPYKEMKISKEAREAEPLGNSYGVVAKQ